MGGLAERLESSEGLYFVEEFCLPLVFVPGFCPVSNDLFHSSSCADAVGLLFQEILIGASYGKRIG